MNTPLEGDERIKYKTELFRHFYSLIQMAHLALHGSKMDGPRDDTERRLLEMDRLVVDELNGEPYEP